MGQFLQVVESLIDYLQDHVTKILAGFVLMGLGWYFGHWRARAHWQKREFYNRLNVSLNFIRDGKLMIRTLCESPAEEIFLNQTAVANVQNAALKTTADDSILPLPQNDYWYYLNSVLNVLSEQFAVGYLHEDLGGPVLSKRYVICLTCESALTLRMRKIRAMVIRKDLLLSLDEAIPALEHPQHETRWRTLRQLAAEYAARPFRFLEVELSLPKAS